VHTPTRPVPMRERTHSSWGFYNTTWLRMCIVVHRCRVRWFCAKTAVLFFPSSKRKTSPVVTPHTPETRLSCTIWLNDDEIRPQPPCLRIPLSRYSVFLSPSHQLTRDTDVRRTSATHRAAAAVLSSGVLDVCPDHNENVVFIILYEFG